LVRERAEHVGPGVRHGRLLTPSIPHGKAGTMIEGKFRGKHGEFRTPGRYTGVALVATFGGDGRVRCRLCGRRYEPSPKVTDSQRLCQVCRASTICQRCGMATDDLRQFRRRGQPDMVVCVGCVLDQRKTEGNPPANRRGAAGIGKRTEEGVR